MADSLTPSPAQDIQNDSIKVVTFLDSAENLFQQDREASYALLKAARELALRKDLMQLHAQTVAYKGWFLGKEGNFEGAIAVLDSAVALFLSMNILSDAAAVKKQMGDLYVDQGDYQAAMDQYIEGSRLAEAVDDYRNLAFCFRGISFLYYQHNDQQRSLENIEKAILTIKKAKFDSADLVDMWHTKALAHGAVGHTDSAIYYYQNAADFTRRTYSLTVIICSWHTTCRV